MKRLKKILKWSGIVLAGLVATLLVANAWFVWTTDTRLERQLQEIRDTGDPLSLAELARPPIPPEKNAATYLRRAEADVMPIWKESGSILTVPEFPAHLMSAKQRDIAKKLFATHPELTSILEEAVNCPDYDAHLDYTRAPQDFIAQLLDVVQEERPVAWVARARAILLASEGQHDESARTGLIILRLARHLDRNPMLTSCLVAIAVRGYAFDVINLALQTGPVSTQVRDALEIELARQEQLNGYEWALKSDRAYGLATFGTFPLRNFWLLARGYWNRAESEYLDEMQSFIALTHDPRPYRQTAEAIDAVSVTLSHPLNQLLVPAVQATHNAVARTRAQIRCLRVLNALQTHVPAGSDEVPKLSELGLPAETTTDPYTGDPLHVKKTPQGWLVYSVGKNFVDDGGKLDDPIDGDVGVGPPSPADKPAEK